MGQSLFAASLTGFDEAHHKRVMRGCTINGDQPF
jgi:alpha-ketoglutarate-dependent taurine dioxygenase